MDSFGRPGVLAVGTALPRGRMSAAELDHALGFEPGRIARELGLSQKAVAVADDEHPVDFCVRAAQAALGALGASAADVGLLIFAGISREYLPSWSVAVEVIGRLGATRALGYDLSLGCAAALLAIEQAAQRHDTRPPLSLVVSAERWSQTLSPRVPFPLALAAHADGGAACVVGTGAALTVGPLHSEVRPEFNDFVQIKAGGTRHPASEDTVRAGHHFRAASRESPGDILSHYVNGYTLVMRRACDDLGVRPGELGTVVINQVRGRIRSGVCAALELAPEHMIDTYRELGHLGGADLFFGLEQAQRSGRLAGRTGVLASSTLSAFVACGFRCDAAGIAISSGG